MFFQVIERICLIGIILGLPLSEMPVRYRLINSLNSLPEVFCMIGVLFICIELVIKKKRVGNYKEMAFLSLYTIWPIICIIIGAYTYSFYTDMNLLDTPRMIKLWKLMPGINDNTFLVVGSAILNIWRMIKEELFPFLGGVALTYHLYYRNWKLGFKDIRIAAVILGIICFIYSIPELLWIWSENIECENLLKFINVHLYDVPQPPAWHPPLLWRGQLRSVFDEPSSFGAVSSFIFPFLLTISAKNKWQYIVKSIFIGLYVLMIFSTQSRTALGIFLVEIISLAVIYISNHSRYYKKKITFLVLSMVLGMLFYNVCPPIVKNIIPTGNSTASAGLFGVAKNENYLERNIGSLGNVSERSNGARYGITVGSFIVGIDHPILGVGRGYESLYIEQCLPDFARNNDEINKWMANCREKGITEMGCFILNQYTQIFATSGILGVILFIFPPFYCGIRILKRRKLLSDEMVLTLFVIFLGQLAAMFSGPYRFTYPIVLALTYIIVKDDATEIYSTHQ